jgi:TctA family transporter
MRAAILLLWILTLIFAIWLQLRYKDANYPNSWRWRICLFASGAASGVFGVVLFLLDADSQPKLAAALYGGLFLGLLFGFASPHSMKGLYPKRSQSEPSHPANKK